MSVGAVVRDLKEYHTQRTVSIVRSQKQVRFMRVTGKFIRSNTAKPRKPKINQRKKLKQ